MGKGILSWWRTCQEGNASSLDLNENSRTVVRKLSLSNERQLTIVLIRTD